VPVHTVEVVYVGRMTLRFSSLIGRSIQHDREREKREREQMRSKIQTEQELSR
jgi:hypothetical protein